MARETNENRSTALKPFKVTVKETLNRTVIVWAEDNLDAEEKAENLCNDSTINLTGEDFSERECECVGAADSNDMDTLEAFGKDAVSCWQAHGPFVGRCDNCGAPLYSDSVRYEVSIGRQTLVMCNCCTKMEESL